MHTIAPAPFLKNRIPRFIYLRVSSHHPDLDLEQLPQTMSNYLCDREDVKLCLSVFLQTYDNGDSQLDSSELLKFIQQNESVVELQTYADQESNKLLRSVSLWICILTCVLELVVDALFFCFATISLPSTLCRLLFASVVMLAHADPHLCAVLPF